MKKQKKEKKEEKQKQNGALKGSVDYLSEYFYSYLSTLKVVNTRN